MPLDFFYTMVQKSQKWPKTQIKGGPALKEWAVDQIWYLFQNHLAKHKSVRSAERTPSWFVLCDL